MTNEILVENYVSDDVTAPGRITDVSILDISTKHTQYGESRNFTITWTATGDDVNIGQGMYAGAVIQVTCIGKLPFVNLMELLHFLCSSSVFYRIYSKLHLTFI